MRQAAALRILTLHVIDCSGLPDRESRNMFRQGRLLFRKSSNMVLALLGAAAALRGLPIRLPHEISSRRIGTERAPIYGLTA